MSSTNTDIMAAQMEKVSPHLQLLLEEQTGIGGMFKRAAESHQISTYTQALNGGGTINAFRLPVKRYIGGDFGTFNYDAGDLGGGSSMRVDSMTLGYFPSKYALDLSALGMAASSTSQQSVVNLFKDQVKSAIKERQTYYDTEVHGSGDGVLATGGGTGSPTLSSGSITYNLETSYGPQRLRLNQTVDIYSNDGTTKRNNLTVRVSSYSLTAKTVTLATAGTITSPTNTDKICFQGMSPTLSVGSWMNGFPVFQNTATSGLTLGLDRTVVTELVTAGVAANNQPLSPALVMLGFDQLHSRRNDDQLGGVKGIANSAQRASWFLQGFNISEWQRGNSDKMIDLVPGDLKFSSTFTMGGVPHMISKKQDRTRVDWLVPDNYCRVFLHDMKWHERPDGGRWFEGRSSTTGNPTANFLAYLITAENLGCIDPGAGVVFSSLALLSGY